MLFLSSFSFRVLSNTAQRAREVGADQVARSNFKVIFTNLTDSSIIMDSLSSTCLFDVNPIPIVSKRYPLIRSSSSDVSRMLQPRQLVHVHV